MGRYTDRMKAALIVLSVAFVGIYGDVNTCSAPNGPCESHGKCATECVATNPIAGVGTPSCTPSPCPDSKTCSWKCITGADACAKVNDACGANNRCITECSASPIVGLGNATCHPACTVTREQCSWKCEVKGNASACAAVGNACGNNGQCLRDCVPSNPVLGTSPPSCAQSSCSAGDVCSWKCINNASVCAAVGNPCGSNGKCSTDCVPSNPVLGKTAPTTCTPVCTGTNKCSWKCITGADACENVNDTCGANSRCVTECSANTIVGLGTATCNPACTVNGESCSWKCEVKAKPPNNGASRPTLLLPLTVLCILFRIQNIHE